MRTKTSANRRLKRLVREYAQTFLDLHMVDSSDYDFVRDKYYRLKKNLDKTIDELTSIDLTPRALDDQI